MGAPWRPTGEGGERRVGAAGGRGRAAAPSKRQRWRASRPDAASTATKRRRSAARAAHESTLKQPARTAMHWRRSQPARSAVRYEAHTYITDRGGRGGAADQRRAARPASVGKSNTPATGGPGPRSWLTGGPARGGAAMPTGAGRASCTIATRPPDGPDLASEAVLILGQGFTPPHDEKSLYGENTA